MRDPLELEILRKLFPEKRFRIDLFPERFWGGNVSWRMVLTAKVSEKTKRNTSCLAARPPVVDHSGKTSKQVSRTVLESVFRFRQSRRRTFGKVFRKEIPGKILPGKVVSFLGKLREAYRKDGFSTRFKLWSSGKVSVAVLGFRHLDGKRSAWKLMKPICYSGRSPGEATGKVLGTLFFRMGVSGLEEAEMKMASMGWKLPEEMT